MFPPVRPYSVTARRHRYQTLSSTRLLRLETGGTMFFSQTAPRDGEYHPGDVAERDPDDGNNSFFGRARSAVEDSDYDGRLRRPKVGATHRSADLDSEQSTDFKPSIFRRTVRAVAVFHCGPDW